MLDACETNSMIMNPFWEVTFQAPEEDIDRIFDHITSFVDLVHGKTDRNAFRTTAGFEYYRPLAGTPTGAEEEVRKRPGVAQITVLIERNQQKLHQVIEAIYEVHSYYEPVIVVREILRSSTKGLDDSGNPHRFWNTTGDWKSNPQTNP